MVDTPFLTWPYAVSGSTALRTNPTRWGEILNVKDFGAVGDGVADDTTAIQNCLDAAFGPSSSPHDGATNLNKPVHFPAGSYIITRPLVTTTVRSGRIYGDGMFCTSIVWGGTSSSFTGNQLGTRAGSTDTGTPDNNITCMWEIAGMARTHISDLQFTFGSNQSNYTAVAYGYGHKTSTQVVWENVCFAGAAYGMILGAGSPNGVSEWKFYNCYFTLNGQAGVFITGQNTLNHDFINTSIDGNGTTPITTTFTGVISGSTLTVTAFTSGASNPYLAVGSLVYNTTGAVIANTTITGLGTGTGGTGTYTVSVSHSTTGSVTMGAINPNFGGMVNINGSAMSLVGCDCTNQNWDVVQGGGNPFLITGTRTESLNFVQNGSGAFGSIVACNTANIPATSISSCTTLGSILTVSTGSVLSGGGFISAGMYVYGTDGANSILENGLNPPVTTIVKQLSSAGTGASSAGTYLLSAQPTGNLTAFTLTAKPQFLTCIGSGNTEVRNCGGQNSVITGSNNATISLSGNNFANPFVDSNTLMRGWAGQILSYDTAGPGAGFFTASQLPTPAAKWKGVRMFITDSSVAMPGNFGTVISTGGGGGTNTVPLTCSGSAWMVA